MSIPSAPPLDFPEIDLLIDDVAAPPPKVRASASLDDVRGRCAAPARRKSAFEAPRRKSASRRGSAASTRRHRTSSAASRTISPQQKARERRRRRTVYIVVGTFLFILFSCVLVVIVTLTHQSEWSRRNGTLTKTYYTFAPPGDLELRAARTTAAEAWMSVRKENEELMNSMAEEDSTDHDSLHNLTASVPNSFK